MDPRLVSLVSEFLLKYLPEVRKLDDDTIASYRSSINIFLDYLAEEHGLALANLRASGLTQAVLVGFLAWLADARGNAATTVNHRLSDVRGLLRFLFSRGVIDQVAWELIREVRPVPDERPNEFAWLTRAEVRAVLASVSANRDAARDELLLSILYESGGRVGEVLSLTVGDLRPTKGGEADVHFFGKGRKHRVVPLSAEAWARFGAYAGTYLPGAKPDDLVFYTVARGDRQRMSHDNVARILRGCEERVKADEFPELQHLHSHLFRRSRAMHLYEAGVALPTISDWLGHSNIETTRFYAKVTELMKREAISKLSESEDSVFTSDVAFKYADDDEVLRRLCGLR